MWYLIGLQISYHCLSLFQLVQGDPSTQDVFVQANQVWLIAVQHHPQPGPLEAERIVFLKNLRRLSPLLVPLLRQLRLHRLLHRQLLLDGRQHCRIARHHCSHPVYLLAKLPDQLDVRVLIHSWLVDDIFGSVGVAKSGKGLVVVDIGRGDGGNHDGLRVASKAVLQQPGQHRVSVWDECLATWFRRSHLTMTIIYVQDPQRRVFRKKTLEPASARADITLPRVTSDLFI